MDYLEGLNEKQLEAVSETEGYVRVIAGAGSGKTKLLVCRYAYLVKEYGIDASNILCVTFTNKAAGEMKRRICSMIGEENETSLVCTYHGFCARLLREDAEKLFLTRSFQIIDTTQQKSILGDIYQKRELKLDYASFERILKRIGEYKNMQYTEYVPRICNPAAAQVQSVIASSEEEIIEEYMQRQKAIGALDFDDLLCFALYLLETDESVRSKWQDRLNYIQVDEFQDSSDRELHLIDILSAGYNNLMIVGDPDQNIYEWRGSDVKLLVDFDKTHVPTKTIFLNRNYRSTPQILKCANALIDNNILRLKKDLYTETPNGARVVHYHSKSEDAENKVISDIIKGGIRSGKRQYSDFAILYRSGFLSRVVEKQLVEQNIPYEIYGGVKFYQRMEIQDIIAYLRLVAFNDDISFKRVINKPRRRFGRVKMAALEQLQENDVHMFNEGSQQRLCDVLATHLHESPFKNSDTAEFIAWLDAIRQDIDSLRITEIVNRVTVETGYEQYIRELGDEERYENLMEFKRLADEFERSFGEQLTLTEFLQQIALQASEDNEQARDAVKLMTIHAAKGLEFPVVFVIGFTEGIFPSSKTIETRKLLGLEEERRLCYVAITRAEEQLYLLDSEGNSQKGMKKLPSRFLREIGVENYERIGTISKELDQESRAYARRLNEGFSVPETEEHPVGETVTHHIFGTGRIIASNPNQRKVKVQFDKLAKPRDLSFDYFKEEHKPLLLKKESMVSAAAEDVPALQILHESEFEEWDESNSAPSWEKEDSDSPQYPDWSDAPGYSEVQAEEEEEEEEAEVLKELSIEIGRKYEEHGEEVSYSESVLEGESEPDTLSIDPELLAKLNEADNLWKRDDVPHSGWVCTGITDLGAPTAICEMCGHQIIRYVHHMRHPNYRPLNVGCVCAGKMEGNMEAARKRERDLKSRQTRLETFKKRKWKRSKSGNQYLKIKEHLIVLFKLKNGGGWKYAIDSVFGDTVYNNQEAAMIAAFHALERIQRK